MRTLDEIKKLLTPSIDWADVLKDAILQKYGENILVSISFSDGIVTEREEDQVLLQGAMVSNNQLLIYTGIFYTDDFVGFEFGVPSPIRMKDRIFCPNDRLKEFTHKVVMTDECDVECDFSNPKWYEKKRFENIDDDLCSERYRDKIIQVINGEMSYTSYRG
jgi:hypothetical protein